MPGHQYQVKPAAVIAPFIHQAKSSSYISMAYFLCAVYRDETNQQGREYNNHLALTLEPTRVPVPGQNGTTPRVLCWIHRFYYVYLSKGFVLGTLDENTLVHSQSSHPEHASPTPPLGEPSGRPSSTTCGTFLPFFASSFLPFFSFFENHTQLNSVQDQQSHTDFKLFFLESKKSEKRIFRTRVRIDKQSKLSKIAPPTPNSI